MTRRTGTGGGRCGQIRPAASPTGGRLPRRASFRFQRVSFQLRESGGPLARGELGVGGVYRSENARASSYASPISNAPGGSATCLLAPGGLAGRWSGLFAPQRPLGALPGGERGPGAPPRAGESAPAPHALVPIDLGPPGGVPEARITARNPISSTRTARSAVPAVGERLISSYQNSRKSGPNGRNDWTCRPTSVLEAALVSPGHGPLAPLRYRRVESTPTSPWLSA